MNLPFSWYGMFVAEGACTSIRYCTSIRMVTICLLIQVQCFVVSNYPGFPVNGTESGMSIADTLASY